MFMKIVTTVTAVTTYTIPRLAVTGVLAQERVHPRLAAGVVIADGVSQHLFIHAHSPGKLFCGIALEDDALLATVLQRVHEAGPTFSDREQRYGGLVTHLGIHTVDLCAPLSWRLAAIS
jgi:hypothetical protein